METIKPNGIVEIFKQFVSISCANASCTLVVNCSMFTPGIGMNNEIHSLNLCRNTWLNVIMHLISTKPDQTRLAKWWSASCAFFARTQTHMLTVIRGIKLSHLYKHVTNTNMPLNADLKWLVGAICSSWNVFCTLLWYAASRFFFSFIHFNGIYLIDSAFLRGIEKRKVNCIGTTGHLVCSLIRELINEFAAAFSRILNAYYALIEFSVWIMQYYGVECTRQKRLNIHHGWKWAFSILRHTVKWLLYLNSSG